MPGKSEMVPVQIVEQIVNNKLFAILRGVKPEHAVETATALLKGGVKLLEVTFNGVGQRGNERTLQCIELIGKALEDDVCIGAGTVVSVEQVELAAEAGARFIVSPNVDREVIAATIHHQMVSLPGALTPTEIVHAYKSGAHLVKLFPGGFLGPEYVGAMHGPLQGIPLVVVGGVDLDNIHSFFQKGAAGVGLGSNLVDSKLANGGNYSAIEEKAKAFITKIREFKE